MFCTQSVLFLARCNQIGRVVNSLAIHIQNHTNNSTIQKHRRTYFIVQSKVVCFVCFVLEHKLSVCDCNLSSILHYWMKQFTTNNNVTIALNSGMMLLFVTQYSFCAHSKFGSLLDRASFTDHGSLEPYTFYIATAFGIFVLWIFRHLMLSITQSNTHTHKSVPFDKWHVLSFIFFFFFLVHLTQDRSKICMCVKRFTIRYDPIL